MKDNIEFRFMDIQDIDAVMEIDRQSFPNPWSRETFVRELTFNEHALYLLMIYERKVIGYCGMWLVADEAHITNIAVLPEYRGKKLGAALLEKMIEIAKNHDVTLMTLEVRVSNVVAQKLYEKFGFQIGGLRKNYYTDNQEDAYVMWVKFEDE